MAITELNFSDDVDLYVDVYIDDIITAKGQLTFRCNHSPYLSIEDNELHYFLKRNEEELRKAKTKIKCIHRGDTYFLYTNKIFYNFIYPKYIIKSERESTYSKLYMCIPGLYQFFNGVRGFDFTNGELRKSIEQYFLKTEFINEKQKYLLTITHDFSISRNKNETNIHEDAVLCIENPTDKITFDDAKKLSFKIKNFFSLIFGVGLSIKYTSLDCNEKGGYSPFYFSNLYFDSDVIKHSANALITHPSYLETNDWHTMLNNFFSEKNANEVEEIWTRFVSMYSYGGFWEYKILGYASILDAYSQRLLDEKKGTKIPKNKMKNIKNDLISLLNEKVESLGISDPEHNKIIQSFCSYISEFKNTLNPTFKERYLHTLNFIDKEFLSIINFTDQDFILIKGIRDAAAHGKPIKIITGEQESGSDFSKLFILLNKIVILLSSLAFKKLGVSEKRFAKMIIHSHNEIKINSDLDTLKLDVYAGDAKVINVDADILLKSKKHFAFDFSILEDRSADIFKFNDSQLLSLMSDFKTASNGMFKNDDFCQYVYEHYYPNAYYCVEVVNKVYLVCEEKKNCLHNVLWVSFKAMTPQMF